MNNRGLAAIVIIAILIMAGAVVYHIYDAPALERFNLRIHVLNNSTVVPIVITNSQSVATPVPFQQMISINWSKYGIQSLINSQVGNIRFYLNPNLTSPLYAWLESGNSPTKTSLVWVKLPNGIGASSSLTIYLSIKPISTTFDGIYYGEAPQLSSTYGQYDNGASVFIYYNVNPTSTTGWTISGTAGQTTSAPSGSHYSTTNALYANSTIGDYLYTSIPNLSTNEIISFNVYTTGLGDLYFLASSSGAGQMVRLDGRGGSYYSGLATTSSWTSWNGPSGISESANTWYKYDVVIAGTSAYAYIGSISDSLATFGTVTSSSAFSIANNGNYLGLVGDGAGSGYITYWNGFIVRAYPPNDVMPSTTDRFPLVPTSIGHLSIGSYAYNVYSLYFNLTLNGYRNYTVTFPQYIEYGGVENTTATIYMSGNITLTVPYVLKGIYPPGRIFI